MVRQGLVCLWCVHMEAQELRSEQEQIGIRVWGWFCSGVLSVLMVSSLLIEADFNQCLPTAAVLPQKPD